MWRSHRKEESIYQDEAISPVIGVILMVAITVILSAVIAGFVYGLPTQVQKPWKVGLDVKQVPGNQIIVTIIGGGDFPRLQSIKGSVEGEYTACNNGDGLSATTTPSLSVGAQLVCNGATNGADHVVVVGRFEDQSEQVLIDTHL